MGDVNLDEIAAQELLNEAKRGAARASLYGALGWQKCPLKPTNKVFLQNILLSTLSSKCQKDSDPDLSDNSKRKLSEDMKDLSLRRHREAERSVQKERQTISNFHDSEPFSREGSKLGKVDNSSWKRKCVFSNSISIDLLSINKERRPDNIKRFCISSKRAKIAKRKSTEEGNKCTAFLSNPVN